MAVLNGVGFNEDDLVNTLTVGILRADGLVHLMASVHAGADEARQDTQ
jgi:hypothetical protein